MREALGKLIELIIDHRGKTPTKLGGEFSSFGVPVLSAKHVKTGKIIGREDLRYTDEQLYRRWMPEELNPGDMILTSEAPLGEVYLLSANEYKFVLGQRLYGLRAKQSVVDSQFLYYALTSPVVQQRLQFRATGTTVLGIRQSELLKVDIDYPADLGEQRRIAQFLGAMDAKVELNRQLSATLEQLARALFQSWFVDFDPVRAKANGEPADSICRRLGLTPELLALFPAALEESVMGEIPAGWEVKPLDKIATFLNGVAAQKYPPTGIDDVPVIKIAQLRKGNTEGANLANGSTVPTAYIVENGDVLFSWSGSLEVEIWGGGLGLLNQHLFKVESEQFPKWFYFIWTRHHLPSFRLTAADKATTMGHIQRKHLTAANVLVPSERLLEEMTVHFSPILAQIEAFSEESVTLAALRDELLPKLLSGDLRLN